MLNKLKDLASQATNKTKEHVDKLQENLNKKTAILGSDDITQLRKSTNPIVTLEERSTPYHVKGAMINFLAATGVLTNATEITRLTRSVMDNDNGPLQTFIRQHFDPVQAREISSWMDKVPDSTIAGGWAHRLKHGHDLEAMMSLYKEYGLVGAAEWFNHVWLRDFWTPHGVPYLPSGSGEVYQWLRQQGVSGSTAMSLVSINAAEALSGILFIRAGFKISANISDIKLRRAYEADLESLRKQIGAGNDVAAYEHLERMLAYMDENKLFDQRLDLAHYCLDMSHRPETQNPTIWGEQAYHIASNLCKARESDNGMKVNYLGATKVSFVGLAASIAATAFASHVKQANTSPEMIKSKIKLGIHAYLKTADDLKKGVCVYGRQIYGYRPYSALTNYKLAMDLALALTQIERVGQQSLHTPSFIRKQMMDLIDELMLDKDAEKSLLVKIKKGLEKVYPVRHPEKNLPAVI